MSSMSSSGHGNKKWITEIVKRKMAMARLVAGAIMLIISVPVFIFYGIFPALNSQIGPHQISSWIAVTLFFMGFVLVIMAAGELDTCIFEAFLISHFVISLFDMYKYR